jgi:Ran GTPase-activating protein (RanGAP) involved in mRNA processing and transport
MHNRSLRTLLLGRNKISNAFMKELCNAIKEMNNIEEIDLTHLKEANKIDWKDYLESLALIAANRPHNPVRVKLSDY